MSRSEPSPMRVTDVAKRLLLGRPMATAQLEHERLGKPTALAVFASDNLSSSAYATEEILRVLVPAIGVAAFALVVPISMALLGVLAILLFSYRQTIKAYPSAGGAYIVTKDNFGLLTAQVAGVALLTDYVLTVSVSVAAGVQSLSSFVEPVHDYRVLISVAFIWIIAWGNLRGVRESGRLFALPTYLFIFSMLVLLGTGLVKALAGGLQPVPPPGEQTGATGVVAVAGMVLVLRAFASGGAAVTGVEAISNGVPAFRRPAWKNARTTLMWMGTILGTLFIGLSLLAAKLHIFPVEDESKSVVAQIAEAVFGTSGLGNAAVVVLLASTMLILVLAANTSFADFPRLANFHAGDNFLPRQFTKRGHRLVFSSGIIWLAVASSALVVAFNASVTNLIPLYALGVFTSFTLSQAGMAKRHLRLREPGWRVGLAINGLGAVVTGVVDVVIAIVKFKPKGSVGGAWMVLVLVPVLVFLLVRMNHQYEAEDRELTDGLDRAEDLPPRIHRLAVLVDRIDEKTMHAVQYALTVAPRSLDLLHISTDSQATAELVRAWTARGPRRQLLVRPCAQDRRTCIAGYAREVVARGEALTFVVPGPARLSWWERVRHGRTGDDVREAVGDLPGVIVVVIREHGGSGHQALGPDGKVRVSPRPHHAVAVFVDRLDRSTLLALRYARSLNPDDVMAYHVGVDPERAARLLESWPAVGGRNGIPLQAVHCPDRNIGRAAVDIVTDLEGPGTEVTVVLPRRITTRLWHRLLHDRTGRTLARALSGRPHVDVVTVPYRLGTARPTRMADPPGPSAETPGVREPAGSAGRA